MPQDAFQQFVETEKWRKDNNLEALYERIDIHDYQEARSVVGHPPLLYMSPLTVAVPTMDWPKR